MNGGTYCLAKCWEQDAEIALPITKARLGLFSPGKEKKRERKRRREEKRREKKANRKTWRIEDALFLRAMKMDADIR